MRNTGLPGSCAKVQRFYATLVLTTLIEPLKRTKQVHYPEQTAVSVLSIYCSQHVDPQACHRILPDLLMFDDHVWRLRLCIVVDVGDLVAHGCF